MTLMTELQYYSPGRQIYYHFGSAYGLTGKTEGTVYLGTEAKVKEALANGKRSVRPVVNRILDRERALVKKYEQRGER